MGLEIRDGVKMRNDGRLQGQWGGDCLWAQGLDGAGENNWGGNGDNCN